MQTLKAIFIFLTLTTLWSCHNTTSNKKVTEHITNDSIKIDTTEVKEEKSAASDEGLVDTITHIKFQELLLTIKRLVVFDGDKKLNETQKDTVYLYSELGETIEGQIISVTTDQLTNVKVEQRYETSVTIMDEGPHCDLIDWKHFNSDWVQLKQNNKGQFICNSYTEKELEKFPDIKIEELKAYVKETCGKEWSEQISKIKSPTEYPSGVGVSRYFIRLTGERKDNGKPVTKLIILEVAMGC